ncbi:alpha-L-fucosidase [Pedobacter hartonius]|uniref:alpha-L-fucosidase n=1 Tax=Pedobacter hartonius TaxID=425514 RepID=A0A1H4BEV7_9SPHI|nr:alpha-L-fucosidase [Pedobacter hartonius]SEA46691.1 alpha-L-fucosidase [Pedobacter hartonius]
MNIFKRRNLLFIPAILVTTVSSYAQRSAPAPYGALPSDRQLKWQETEMYCIVHFTPTTFQNKEWGYGDADPSIFNPLKFNADQIVAAAKSGGFKGIVYVAKHHDGFALWPTKTSTYNISESPWKNGKGDMVKEFQMAAKQEGMKFGIYCSPWDRSNTTYGTPEYVDVYRKQITELYSNYGDLFMSWHDGANGGDGFYGGKNEKRKVDQSSYYDWMNTWAITRKLQPNASVFSDIGLDVRWVGNEKGLAPETSWSTITIKGKEDKAPMPGFMDDNNLGSGTRDGKQWIPFEGDVALRPGWFYHPEQDNQLKTTAELFNIYCSSVGRGGALDLGLSPTTEGILHQNDVAALAAFGKYLNEVFAVNLTRQAAISVSNLRGKQQKTFGTANLTDGDRYTYWATDDNVHQAAVNFTFKQPVRFSLIQLRENIKLGQRIDSVAVEAFKDGQWFKLAKATSIGANRIIRLPKEETALKVRIHVYAPVSIALSEIGLYLQPKLQTVGTQKDDNSYDKTSWKTVNDNNSITIDPGKTLTFSALSYLPDQEKSSAGAIEKYELLTSEDGRSWKSQSSGEFSNIEANPILQRIVLPQTIAARYIKIVSKQAVPGNNGKVQLNGAQIEIYK